MLTQFKSNPQISCGVVLRSLACISIHFHNLYVLLLICSGWHASALVCFIYVHYLPPHASLLAILHLFPAVWVCFCIVFHIVKLHSLCSCTVEKARCSCSYFLITLKFLCCVSPHYVSNFKVRPCSSKVASTIFCSLFHSIADF